ncbi:hypothetical protein GCM10010383_73610 [Streptomyces lomondensis]|uniref:Uncharacterized protein n=1 Tax=Streptomyces lomondensis TaxID=68229 RepID=A0ABQ2XTA1_9ACTN|nr:hypothetical protein GCM10010383_73610 [Streptomyces lomondensis]
MEEVPYGQGSGCLTAQGQAGGAGQTEYLAAAEIDGESHGQHSGSVSTWGGGKLTRCPPGGDRGVTGR